MSRPTTLSPAVIKHISRIASRGDLHFAKAFLEAQNYPEYLNIAILKDLEASAESGVKETTLKKALFYEKYRNYEPRSTYKSKPRRFRNSISLS